MCQLDSFQLFISTIASLVAACTGLYLCWSRDGLPNIIARTNDFASKAWNSDFVTRQVRFDQQPDSLRWVVYEVRIAKSRHKWIAVPGEGERDHGNFLGWPLGGAWTDRIRYDPPVSEGFFLLHPDAPPPSTLFFLVRLRSHSRFRTKQWVNVPSTPTAVRVFRTAIF